MINFLTEFQMSDKRGVVNLGMASRLHIKLYQERIVEIE